MAIKGDKLLALRSVCKAFGCTPRIAVETGTWRGDTTAAMSTLFEHVYTVELSETFHRRAVKRFAHTNIRCLFGESGQVVAALAGMLQESVYWYLDAHSPYGWPAVRRAKLPTSHPMPLWHELEGILARRHTDIIIVDDIHAFGEDNEWREVTVDKLLEVVRPSRVYELKDGYCMLRQP